MRNESTAHDEKGLKKVGAIKKWKVFLFPELP